MIGLKQGSVYLCEHEAEWEKEAAKTISLLKKILGSVIKDIQHVGSTSIPSIKAKPIIDIALAADSFSEVLKFENELKDNGFYFRPSFEDKSQLLFACGSYYSGTGELQTHFIHVVHTDSAQWRDYINFRDYLNQNPEIAKEYEALKRALAAAVPASSGRKEYTKGKHDFIAYTLRKALTHS